MPTDARTTTLSTRLAASVLALGLVLLAFMVTTEGEPGALPLGLVLLGGVGLVAARRGARRS